MIDGWSKYWHNNDSGMCDVPAIASSSAKAAPRGSLVPGLCWLAVFLYIVYKSKPDNLRYRMKISSLTFLSPDQTVRGSSTWRPPHPHLSLCRRSGPTSPCHVSFLSKWHFVLRCLGCAGSLVLIATTLSSSTPSTMPSPGMISFMLLYSLSWCVALIEFCHRCPHCRKVSSVGPEFARTRSVFLSFSLKN